MKLHLMSILVSGDCSDEPSSIPGVTCNDDDLRWYYDSSANRCEEYPSNACITSANRFSDMYMCENACSKYILPVLLIILQFKKMFIVLLNIHVQL